VSASTDGQAHSGDWIAGDISPVLGCLDKTPFVGAVTDNTQASKKAWVIFREKYSTMFFQGCTSHSLHSMVKDIFAATKTKKGRDLEPTFPDGFPFESLVQFSVDCKDIIKFFHKHHVVKSISTGRSQLMSNPIFRGCDWSNHPHVSRQLIQNPCWRISNPTRIVGTGASKRRWGSFESNDKLWVTHATS
jgi:Protein of unknown function (DUF 659)